MSTIIPASVKTVAIDVGGVLYYDEPFELVWLQGVLERACQADPNLTAEAFAERVREFYLHRSTAAAPPGLFPPAGTASWAEVRCRWTTLVQPINGALDALASIADEWPVCVVANQPPECTAALGELGVDKHLQFVALDSLVGHSKPDPAIFQWTFDRLGWTPDTTLVVGDRPDHDAAPAQTLGCHTALVGPADGWVVPPGVDAVVVAAHQAVCEERVEGRSHPAAAHSSRFADITGVAAVLRTHGLPTAPANEVGRPGRSFP